MDFEQVEKWKEEASPFHNPKIIARNVLIMILGILIFLFKYLALTFSDNAIIEDSFRHYDLDNIKIDSVWEKGDLKVIVVLANTTPYFDLYYMSSGLKLYDQELTDFFSYTPEPLMIYSDQLETDGFHTVAITLYKMLGFIQFVGALTFAIGGLMFLHNPRKKYGYAQVTQAKVDRIERLEKYYGSLGSNDRN